jgi:hypothetical protein
MANVNVDIKDTFDQWRVKTNEISDIAGDLATLTTTDKSDIIAAINELVTRSTDIGTLASLDTDYLADLVGAINEVNTNADQNTTDIGTNETNITANTDIIAARIPFAHDSLNDAGNAGSTLALDTVLYDSYKFVVDISPLTLSETTMAIGRTVDIILTNGGGKTINWPTGTIWAGGSPPTFTTTGTDRVSLQKISAGVIHATLVGLAYA